MQSLYEQDFRPDALASEIKERNLSEFSGSVDVDFLHLLVDGVNSNRKELDKSIAESAPEWPLDQIAPLDRIVLEIAIFELLFEKNTPPKVAIDEAVELAKQFGSENSSKFINGVLGTVFKKLKL